MEASRQDMWFVYLHMAKQAFIDSRNDEPDERLTYYVKCWVQIGALYIDLTPLISRVSYHLSHYTVLRVVISAFAL